LNRRSVPEYIPDHREAWLISARSGYYIRVIGDGERILRPAIFPPR